MYTAIRSYVKLVFNQNNIGVLYLTFKNYFGTNESFCKR